MMLIMAMVMTGQAAMLTILKREGQEDSRYIPSEKIGQNFHPSESCFFVINYQHWTGRSAFGPFLALLDHGGGLGGPGGVMRGLKTLKMTLSIGDHLRTWNAMFWVVTTSYTMFLWFWVKTGPSGPKKGCFWPK